MNVQAAPSPYTPVGGSNMASGNPPVLGSQVPGSTGGLPALGGLSPMQNPMAKQLQSMGRDEDTMLVHMTPGEVNSLQGLAMAAGGSLTINPQTGLPEAGFLKKLLPMLAGIGLNFVLPGSGLVATLGGKAATAGLMTAAAGTAITGDLNKGLMAGLQAFGGASLAGGIQGAMGGAAKTAGAAAPPPVPADAAAKVASATPGAQATVPGSVLGMQGTQVPAALLQNATQDAALQGGIKISPSLSKALAGPIKAPGTGLLSQFGQAAKGTMGGLGAKAAPMLAASGVLSSISDATAPQMPRYNPDDDNYEYTPMAPGVREVRFQTPEQIRESGGKEFKYFTPTNPDPVPRGFAEGGATSAPPQGFDELVQYFGANNPGAITAPSTYPSATPAAPTAPTSRGETIYNFGKRSTAGNLGLTDASNLYGTTPGMGGLGGFNFSAADYDAAINRLRNDLGINSGSAAPVAPPVNPPIFGGLDNSYPRAVYEDIYDGGYSDQSSRPTAPRLATDLPGGENYGGPYYTPMPAFEQVAPTPTPTMPLEGADPGAYYDYSSRPTAPRLATDLPGGEMWGGPYYTTLPPMPLEEASPGYGGGRFDMSDGMMTQQFAQGGPVDMRDGAFVVDARTVSELGNGSSNAGIEMLSRMGGRPVRGPGDGVSDSVKASIGGKQEARVARDEVIFQPEAVRRLGGGSDAKGTKKLYAMMEKAHKARKKAGRGQDTGLRRGLA